MRGVYASGLGACLAVGLIGGVLNGCGGSLGGGGGKGGFPDPTGVGGTTGVAGRVGRGGAGGGGRGGAGGSGDAFGEPACLSTVTKGAVCGPTDQQLCYKPCGPEKTGVKSETCVGDVYAEMSGCSFDASKDFACYRIPTAANTACPANAVPMAGGACDLPHCTVCNSLQGLAGGMYVDSSGAPKIGFCVCQEPNAAGMRTWSCASDTAWPCPVGAGCGGSGGVTGSAGSTGAAGATGRGGAGGAGGSVGGVGGSDGSFGQPACPSTVTKGGACAPTDIQFCYKTCGPESVGVKSDTCTTAGTYAEMSGCTFDPARDYSCYKIPPAANAACAMGVTPQASSPCDVPPCSLCNSLQGAVGGQYLDSSGAAKLGWCVCKAPNAQGARTWSCASDTAWPCPLGAGC